MSDFSGFLNEEIILINDLIFLRKAVKQYISHLEKKHNNHMKIGNFTTHWNRELFMICSLCEDKHDLDDCKLFKEKALQE